MIRIANLHNIPVLDLYNYSGLDPNLDDMLYNFYNENGVQDKGVHPNSKGHKFMYPLWKSFLIKEFNLNQNLI